MSTDSSRAARVVWNRSDAKCIVHIILLLPMCVLFTVDVQDSFIGLQHYSVNPRLKTRF